jgi:hypothetical protein
MFYDVVSFLGANDFQSFNLFFTHHFTGNMFYDVVGFGCRMTFVLSDSIDHFLPHTVVNPLTLTAQLTIHVITFHFPSTLIVLLHYNMIVIVME